MATAFQNHAKRSFLGAAALTLLIGWAPVAVRAETISDDNVAAMVAAGKTPAEHKALAAFFTAKAEAALAKVEMHRQMAANPGLGGRALGRDRASPTSARSRHRGRQRRGRACQRRVRCAHGLHRHRPARERCGAPECRGESRRNAGQRGLARCDRRQQ